MDAPSSQRSLRDYRANLLPFPEGYGGGGVLRIIQRARVTAYRQEKENDILRAIEAAPKRTADLNTALDAAREEMAKQAG